MLPPAATINEYFGLPPFRLQVAVRFIICLGLISSLPSARASEITITIPLDSKSTYSPRDVYSELNQKLGGSVDLRRVSEERIAFTPRERLILSGLKSAGLLDVQFKRDQLIFRVPESGDATGRIQQRKQLARDLRLPPLAWPDGMGLHRPVSFNPTKKSILLIHGLGANLASLAGLKEAFQRLGIQVFSFDYPSDLPIARSGVQLSAEMKKLHSQVPDLRLVVVAHSMGGLVARHCLETPGLDPTSVTDVFFLGTPHEGSHLAQFHGAFDAIARPERRWAEVTESFANAADDLDPRSPFLKELNGRRAPPNIRYYCIVGKKGRHSVTVRPSNDQRSREYDELRPGLGDGCVSIKSASLKLAVQTETLELDHLQLIAVPERTPQQAPVVQWIIKTLGWTP